MKSGNFFKASGICMFASAMILSNSVRAQTSDQQLQQEIKQLEQQVNALSAEVNQLKRQKVQYVRVQSAARPVATPTNAAPVQANTFSRNPGPASFQPNAHQRHFTALRQGETSVQNAKQQLAQQHYVQEVNAPATPPPPIASTTEFQGERITRGNTVTTSPYLGLRSAFDASDLVVNISTMNEDLRLLQQRETIEKAYTDAGLGEFVSDRPQVELSGTVQAQGIYQDPYAGHTVTDITLNKAEFDILTYVSPAVLGVMTFTYDSSPLPTLTDPTGVVQVEGTGFQIANSRIFLKRGFITIGDLHRFPLYVTMGQMFAPFGDYSSQLLTTPLTQQLGQINERMVLVGIAPFNTGFYLEGFAYNGNTFIGNNNAVDNGGGNIGYKYTRDNSPISFNIGAGIIGNVADSVGMQLVSSPAFGGPPGDAFQGFGFTNNTEQIKRRVPAADAHGELDWGKLTLLGEYIGATQSFDPANLSYNDGGAEPKALHLEGDYTFHILNWPSVFTLAYDHSWEALPIFLPKDSYVAELTTSIWKDTIEGLEIRHDQNYPSSDHSSGNGFPIPVASLGGGETTVTLQAGYYF